MNRMSQTYPIPSVQVPPCLLAFICKTLDNTETSSGDANHLQFQSELLVMSNRTLRTDSNVENIP